MEVRARGSLREAPSLLEEKWLERSEKGMKDKQKREYVNVIKGEGGSRMYCRNEERKNAKKREI